MKIGARIGSIASIALLVGLAGAACMSMRGPSASDKMSGAFDGAIAENARRLMDEGRTTFRHDTFGSEEFWGGALQLHQAIAGQKHGGVGAGVSPKQALAVGLKVDVAALPPALVDALKAGKVDLDDPGSTLALLKANGVVGVTGFFDPQGRITSLGVQCALCHSTVDDALAAGIGHRLDGWPNSDLDIGAVVALAPTLKPYVDLLGVDEATVRRVLASWGPGKFDAQLTLDGKAFRPDGKPAATLIPPAFGLAGVNQHTWTGSWGGVTYWNAFVANLEMHGRGNFFDPRLNNREQYPVAARAGLANRRVMEDRITPKLAALHFYQLAMPVPKAPAGAFDQARATRGQTIFSGKARCATCHVPPLFTEPGWNLHRPDEIGIDAFQADRSPDRAYRTTPLRALWDTKKIHKGGFYHDGRFSTLPDVVSHYNRVMSLGLTAAETQDLIEFLKSL
jgi:mono/diheme cytochrome c family protein